MRRRTFPRVKVLATNYLVDAGPIIGLFSHDDQWHDWSHEVLTALDTPLATTETIWAEICHHLTRDRPSLIAAATAVREGNIVLHAGWSEVTRMIALLEKYPRMDAGDASLVVLSERLPKARIITTDVRDFTVYRRFRNEPLPLIHP